MLPPLPKIINQNFYNWFNKSKIVDTNGKPQICYHKSRSIKPFKEFSHHLGEKNDYNDDYGFYFVAEYKRHQVEYIGTGVEFYVFIKMENPFHFYDNGKGKGGITDDAGNKYDFINISKELCDKLESQGYDGIIIMCPLIYNQYIVWNGNQIKSIENNGGYLLQNNDIYN